MTRRLNEIRETSVRKGSTVCRGFLTSDQTITGSGGTTVVFDEEDDTEGYVKGDSTTETGWLDITTGHITPPIRGMYRVTTKIDWASNADTSRRVAAVQRNGTGKDSVTDLNQGATVNLVQRICSQLILMDGDEDYFSVEVKEYATGTQDVNGNASGTKSWIMVELVRRLDVLKG